MTHHYGCFDKDGRVDGMTLRRVGTAMMLAAGLVIVGVLLVAGALAGVASLICAVVIVIVITLLLLYLGV